MSRKDKLESLIRNRPQAVTFDDLARLLEWYGFSRRETGSSHVYFKHPHLPERLSIPRHGSTVKPIYVTMAMELIDRLKEGANEDD